MVVKKESLQNFKNPLQYFAEGRTMLLHMRVWWEEEISWKNSSPVSDCTAILSVWPAPSCFYSSQEGTNQIPLWRTHNFVFPGRVKGGVFRSAPFKCFLLLMCYIWCRCVFVWLFPTLREDIFQYWLRRVIFNVGFTVLNTSITSIKPCQVYKMFAWSLATILYSVNWTLFYWSVSSHVLNKGF